MIMVLAALLPIIAGPPVQTKANGLDDYLTATELSHQPPTTTWAKIDAGNNPDGLTLPGLPAKATRLQAAKWAAKNLTRIIDLIRSGNAKPIAETRKFTSVEDGGFDFGPPPLKVGGITRVVQAVSYAKIAEGATSEGLEIMLDGLECGDRVTKLGGSLDAIVGIGMTIPLRRTLAENLRRLSRSDLVRLTERKVKPLTAAEFLEDQSRELGSTIAQVLNVMLERKSDSPPKSDLEKTVAAYARRSPADQKAFVSAVKASTQRRIRALIPRYSVPPYQWPTGKVSLDRGESEADIVASDPTNELIEYFPGVLTMIYRNQTLEDLLKIHTKLEIYRWDHNRYPKTLTEAGIPEMDPGTGRPYIYRLDRNRFRLISEGRPETGEIDLLRRANLVGTPEPVPPLN